VAGELSGKRALVTGATRGIGREIARSLCHAGADVALNFRTRADAAEALRAELAVEGRTVITVRADVSRVSEVERMMTEVRSSLGEIDVLVNNAGVSTPIAIEDLTEGDWDAAIETNLKSAFLVTQAVVPGMRARRWGRLIFISSVAARVGGVVGPHYAASKAGMHGLMHYYAAHLAREGVTANAVAPALIDTEMVRANPNARRELIPVGRFGEPEEVASVVLMLAENGYITGQVIDVNGGWYFT
jgi:3-oxoacyl-[acyl-carrier protein] reductase